MKFTREDIAMFARSWIPAELAAAAHLRRVDSAQGGELIGQPFSVDCAGIDYGYYWPGETMARTHRIRRDHPEMEVAADGTMKQRRKYLGEAGRQNRLYFFPDTDPALLADAKLPIVFTEGEKKTLALWRLATLDDPNRPAFLPIGLSGVSNWRGTIGKTTDAKGNRVAVKDAISDLDRIELEKRTVTILFDADVQARFDLRERRRQFAQHLSQKRKAKVRICDIPAEAAAKGIDDLLCVWEPAKVQTLIQTAPPADVMHDVRQLIAEATAAGDYARITAAARLLGSLTPVQIAETRSLLSKAFGKQFHSPDFDRILKDERAKREAWRREQEERDRPVYRGLEYECHPKGFIWWKRLKEGGHAAEMLANFSCQIVSDVARDDGDEVTRALRLACNVGGRMTEITISAQEFSEMSWAIKYLGARANVWPQAAPRLRFAIQQVSEVKGEERVYQHTGWTERENESFYLHAGGGIGAAGLDATIQVELERSLRFYELPPPPAGEERRQAILASLAMLGTAPDRVTLPLYSAIWRSVLGPVDTSIFLAGQTGSGKSQLAALAQQHFGKQMHANHLPANWSSTGNALEAIAHKTKNALLTVDDFVPQGGANDVQRLHATAERLLRAQGNTSGRQRMTNTAALKNPKSPRGLILATGEDVPHGHSLRARLLVLELEPTDVEWKQLTGAQRDAGEGQYAAAMAAFVQWLAPRMPRMEETLSNNLTEIRAGLAGTASHKRTPGNIANLSIGLKFYLQFAVECGAITAGHAAEIWQRSWIAYGIVVAQQHGTEQAAEPCGHYLELVLAALRSGRAHLKSTAGFCPDEEPGAWGWQIDAKGDYHPRGDAIGWLEEEEIFLDPHASYAAAQSMARSSGSNLPIPISTLTKRLNQRGLLSRIDQKTQTTTIRKTFSGQSARVLAVFTETLLGVKKTQQTQQTQQDGEMLGFSGGLLGSENVDLENPAGNPAFLSIAIAGLNGKNGSNAGFAGIKTSTYGPPENSPLNPQKDEKALLGSVATEKTGTQQRPENPAKTQQRPPARPRRRQGDAEVI